MALISRALIQKFRYFKGSTAVLLKALNETQTYSRDLSSTFPIYSNSPQRQSRDLSDDYMIEMKRTKYKNYNVFKGTNINTLFRSDVSEAAILNTVNKLLVAYRAMELDPKFEKQLREFVNTEDFLHFCKMLESKIHKFSLENLLMLFDLEYFKVPQTSSLMTNISKLVFDKTMSTSDVYEKLLIYGTTLMKPCEEPTRKKIIDECEAYINKSLAFDLQSRKYSSQLQKMIAIRGLPKDIKLILAEKLYDDILSGKIPKLIAINCLFKLAEDNDLLSRERWFNLLKFCFELYTTAPLLRKTSLIYFILLKKDTSYYNPELFELMMDKVDKRKSCFLSFQFEARVCAAGHFSKELLDNVIKYLPEMKFSREDNSSMVISSFLAQASFHEVVPESVAKKIRYLFETKEIFDMVLNLQNSSLWCMYLTYIGCDTRPLLSRIFKRANNKTDTGDSNLLTLHHFAKAYFPGEYESLSERTVDKLVEAEFKGSNLRYPEDNISECFESKDFILKNCITPDRHCLHFVAVFHSDRKLMNLAKYSKKSGPKNFLNVDTIEKPEGSKMVAFVLFPYDQPIRFHNLPSMTGSAKMYLKSLEGVGCDIVLLHKTFFNLSLEDKKKFLKSQINGIMEKS